VVVGSVTRLLGRLSELSKAKARSDWGSDRALSAESPVGGVGSADLLARKHYPSFSAGTTHNWTGGMPRHVLALATAW